MREISTDGMQLELRRPLPAGFCGVVCLSWQNVHLELQVRLRIPVRSRTRCDSSLGRRRTRCSGGPGRAAADPAEPADRPGLVLVR